MYKGIEHEAKIKIDGNPIVERIIDMVRKREIINFYVMKDRIAYNICICDIEKDTEGYYVKTEYIPSGRYYDREGSIKLMDTSIQSKKEYLFGEVFFVDYGYDLCFRTKYLSREIMKKLEMSEGVSGKAVRSCLYDVYSKFSEDKVRKGNGYILEYIPQNLKQW